MNNQSILEFGKALGKDWEIIKAHYLTPNTDEGVEYVHWKEISPREDMGDDFVRDEDIKYLAFEWLVENEEYFINWRWRRKFEIELSGKLGNIVLPELLSAIMKAAIDKENDK